VKFERLFFELQADRQTDRHTDALIAVLRTPIGDEEITNLGADPGFGKSDSSHGLEDERPLVGSRGKTPERSLGYLVYPETDDFLLILLQ